jgi:hypothetical protein
MANTSTPLDDFGVVTQETTYTCAANVGTYLRNGVSLIQNSSTHMLGLTTAWMTFRPQLSQVVLLASFSSKIPLSFTIMTASRSSGDLRNFVSLGLLVRWNPKNLIQTLSSGYVGNF